VESERLRRAKSCEAPIPPRTHAFPPVGSSLLGGVKRGKSAQAALGVSPSPASNPAPEAAATAAAAAVKEEREREQDALDWRDSLSLSDETAISFDFEEVLDQVFEAV
jgi:hypothetical protein